MYKYAVLLWTLVIFMHWDAENDVYANPDDIHVIFCTTPSVSTIPDTFYSSFYNDNAAVYLGSRTCLNILAISCDINFATLFATVILDFTAFISSRCLTRNHVAVCSFLAHLISNFNSENLHSFTKEVRVSTLHFFNKVSPWYFRTSYTFHISREEFTFIFLIVWIIFVFQ